MYPLSNCIPSTNFTSVWRDFPSSTVMTPSLPTFSMASPIISPASGSLLAAIRPTLAISSRVFTLTAIRLISLTAASTARSMPRLSAIAFAPAVTFFRPSSKIASASTVAVVVPSPATSLVLEATSRTRRAPMFSYGSFRSISLATETPSLVTVGAPKLFSNITL